MKRIIIILLLLIPGAMMAKENTGIHFEQNLSWQQIKEKAKTENKYIFIDCFATWCGPCKQMDQQVYPLSSVGDEVNNNFISVKVQMDVSKNDDDRVKSWYADAKQIQNDYKVSAFPTFLFLSSEGQLSYRDMGFYAEADFIRIVKDAHDPNKQYNVMLDKYKAGKLEPVNMLNLASVQEKNGDKDMARLIRNDYAKYLVTLSDRELYTKDNLLFLAYYDTPTTSSKGFDIFYHYGKQADSIVGQPGLSNGVVNFLIAKEEIAMKVYKDNKSIPEEPNWQDFADAIKKKYGAQYIEPNLFNVKAGYYRNKKDWNALINLHIENFEKHGLDTAGLAFAGTNDLFYDVFFKHSNNKKALEKAATWMQILLKNHPDDYYCLDTYANLLYKLGKKKEAIEIEERVVQLASANASKNNHPADPIFAETVSKMKNNIPTWPQN